MQKSMPEIADDDHLMEDDSEDDLESLDDEEAAAAAEFDDLSDMGSIDTEAEDFAGIEGTEDSDDDSEGGSDGVMDDAGLSPPFILLRLVEHSVDHLLFGSPSAEFGSEDEEAFELDEDSDDLLDEDDLPSGFPLTLAGSDSDSDDADATVEASAGGKRKRAEPEPEKKDKKKKKQKLPMWGSYEDYQKLIEDGGPDDNI